MHNNKNKFALWISPDVRELVDANYKADCCRSRSDYIEKAIRFYTGYLHAEKAGERGGVVCAHLGHKLPQCGRFPGFRWGVTKEIIIDSGTSNGEKLPCLRGKFRGR